jgi:formyl-CoA transferase
LHTLLATTDILIHNMRPGVVDALGIDGASVCARHPQLIYCEISGFGHQGPMRALPAFEPVAQAFSGLLSINGHPDGPPARLGVSLIDMGTAMWTVIGALAALSHRQVTGRGGIVNTSLLETALGWASPHIAAYLNEGRTPQRLGTAHPHLVPYQTFEAADGALLIAAGNDRLFERLCGVLGKPEWITDARFSGNRARIDHRAELIALIAQEIASKPRQMWLQQLTSAGVPCAPVNTIPDVLREPQVEALGILQEVPDTGVVLTGIPLSFDGVRPQIRTLGPRLGQDNDRKLGDGTFLESASDVSASALR